MGIHSKRRWPRWTIALALTTLGLFGAAQPADAADLSGRFFSHQVYCPTLCTAGTLTGGLAGTFNYTMHVQTPTLNPNVVILIGTMTVTTATGTISGPDVTLWNTSTGQFVDYTTFTSGTGSFAGATGAFVIVGTFDIASGTGESDYQASITLP